MRITKQADYAIRVVKYLSAQREDRIVTVDEVSKDRLVPKSFASKIFQRLCRAGITESRRGVRGGFILSRRPEDITVLDVVEAIDGPISINQCVVDASTCPLSDQCDIHPIWVDIHADILRRLKEATFDRLNGHSKQ